MDRRTFLTTTGAAAAATALGSATEARPLDGEAPAPPGSIGSGRELRLALAWSADVPVFGAAAADIARRLAAILEGRCRIRPEPMPDMEPLAGDAGAPDLFFAPGEALASVVPAMAYFTGLPGDFGLDASALQAWLVVGGGQMLWDDLAADHGFKPLLAGHTGAPGLWVSSPLAALDGLKIALAPSRAAVARTAGAEPVHAAAAVLCRELAACSVAAVEWGNPLAAVALGFHEAAGHYYPGGLNPGGSALVLGVRLEIWEAMSGSERAMVEAIAAQAWSLAVAESRAHEAMLLKVLRESPTVEIGEVPPAVLSRWNDAAAAIVGRLPGISREIARIHDSYMAWRHQLGLDCAGQIPAPQA
jgi:TRAP-type mannitol/chloroaromatic compound transport system substrate-binding protein